MTDPHDEVEPVRCTCGLPLTAPESVARGLGRVCYERFHGKPPPQPRRTARKPAAPGPGQAELPLADQLAIWPPVSPP